MVSREQLHQAIDELSPKSLEKLSEFVEFLRFKEDHPDWFGKLYDLFEPVRAGVEASGMTEDEVNQIIDEAIEEVRSERRCKD